MLRSVWSVEGKTVLVTGATSGIGEETALGLARARAHVVVVGRSAEKTRQIVEGLRVRSGSSRIDFVLGDLSLMSDVRRVAAEVTHRYAQLHVLVNNVGAIQVSRQTTAEGFEATFALNHLGVFLLTTLLLPALQRGVPSRIVTVSSGAYLRSKMYFDDLQLTRNYSAFRAYGQSKLANVLFTRELSRRLAGTGVTANTLHPGFVGTNIAQKGGVLGAVGHAFTRMFGKSPEKGARTSLFLAMSPEVDGVTGEYFDGLRPARLKPHALDETAARRLWAASEDLVSAAAELPRAVRKDG